MPVLTPMLPKGTCAPSEQPLTDRDDRRFDADENRQAAELIQLDGGDLRREPLEGVARIAPGLQIIRCRYDGVGTIALPRA